MIQKTSCFMRPFLVTMNRMHIAKLSVMVCVAAVLGTSSLLAQKPDTAAQAAAREKLRETEAQLEAQQGAAPATAAPAQAPAPAPVIAPAPQSTTFTATAPPPTTSGNGLNQSTEEKAREQLHQAESQLQAQQPSQPAVPEEPRPVVKVQIKEKPAKKNAKVAKAATPMAAPAPPPAFGSKEQRLADLLQLYKSDKITPADYHEQRAKILAEP